MHIREFLDKFTQATSDGWLEWDEALLLAAYAELTRGPLVEVGSYAGRSAMLLAQLPDHAYRDRYRRLYCVDPWADGFNDTLTGDDVFRMFAVNMAKISGADVVPVRARVEDTEPIPAEFVYLDGDHTYAGTKYQIEWALRCQPRFVAVHDVDDEGDGRDVKLAITKLLGPWKERIGRLAVWEVRNG